MEDLCYTYHPYVSCGVQMLAAESLQLHSFGDETFGDEAFGEDVFFGIALLRSFCCSVVEGTLVSMSMFFPARAGRQSLQDYVRLQDAFCNPVEVLVVFLSELIICDGPHIVDK